MTLDILWCALSFSSFPCTPHIGAHLVMFQNDFNKAKKQSICVEMVQMVRLCSIRCFEIVSLLCYCTMIVLLCPYLSLLCWDSCSFPSELGHLWGDTDTKDRQSTRTIEEAGVSGWTSEPSLFLRVRHTSWRWGSDVDGIVLRQWIMRREKGDMIHAESLLESPGGPYHSFASPTWLICWYHELRGLDGHVNPKTEGETCWDLRHCQVHLRHCGPEGQSRAWNSMTDGRCETGAWDFYPRFSMVFHVHWFHIGSHLHLLKLWSSPTFRCFQNSSKAGSSSGVSAEKPTNWSSFQLLRACG